LKKDPQGFWVFERTIQGSRDGMLKDMPDDKSLKDFWGTYEMKFVVHFPGLVMEANTKQIKKDTATWTIPLSALSGGKRKMRATYRIGKPRKREAQGLKTAWDEKGDWLNTVRHGNCRGA
jgi:hypothetical protein